MWVLGWMKEMVVVLPWYIGSASPAKHSVGAVQCSQDPAGMASLKVIVA